MSYRGNSCDSRCGFKRKIGAVADPVVSPWVIPAAKLALDPNTQNAVKKAWNSVLNALLGRESTIAFTGMSGIGKTVLFDYLTGEAFRPGYQPPE